MAVAALTADPETKVLLVAGPPQALRGELRLRNDSGEKLKLRGVPLRARPGAKSLQQIDGAILQMGARLRPGEQALVPLELSLGGNTAPGVYEMEMELGGRAVQVQAHVTEQVDFKMEPSAVTLLANGRRTIEREFIAENAGNVPLPLGARCEAPLSDSLDFFAHFQAALRNHVGLELKQRIEKVLDEIGRAQTGPLIVHRERVILQPGERRTMTARFELPEDIKPSRHYRALLELYNATLTVDIYTTEKAGQKG